MRPEVGAWRLRSVDGGLADLGEAPDGRLDVDLTALKALEETGPAWDGFGPKDLLIGIDPRNLEIFVFGLKALLPAA